MDIKKIAITGPESTGKSTLTKKLANYFNEPYVDEYARMYLNSLDRTYSQADLLNIAQGQVKDEQQKIKTAKQFLFVDTEMVNMKIWSLHKYGSCHEWILDHLSKQDYTLHLLCNIDLPWENDPLRENPGLREFFMSWFIKELESYNFPYIIISGNAKQRFSIALEALKDLTKL